MKIIYCGHGEIITAWVAGLIHLTQLPRDYIPSLNLIDPIVPQTITRECGIPVYVGSDKDNQIYAIDLGNDEKLAYLTIAGVIADSKERWSFRDLTSILNYFINWGGILRKFYFIKTGRRLILHGIVENYFQLARLVSEPTGIANDSKIFGESVKQL